MVAMDAPTPTAAFTRDTNGDGLVDHVELNFSEPVLLPTGGDPRFFFNDVIPDTNFAIDSVVFDGTVSVLLNVRYLQAINAAGNTGVVPILFRYASNTAVVSYAGVPLEPGGGIVAKDGAQPAIMSATATIGTSAVFVTLSENTTGVGLASLEWAGVTAAAVLDAVYSATDQTVVILTLDRLITDADAGLGDSAAASIEMTDSNGILDAANNTARPGSSSSSSRPWPTPRSTLSAPRPTARAWC